GQTRNHSQNALLLRYSQSRLESDDVPHVAVLVFAAQLHHGPRTLPCSRVGQPDGLEWSESQSVSAALGSDFNRHAALEVRHFVELVTMELIGSCQGLDERIVLFAIHRAVQVR